MLSLLHTSKLVISRYTEGRELLESGEFASSQNVTSQDIFCSIQPFSGISQKMLPEGHTSEDARLVYTNTKLQTTSQFTKIQADETQIDGLTYECFLVEDWNQFGLIPDHYRCIFVRKDEDV